ncbi:MAG: GNAT family N-acetyltransferase [Acidimicrobiales bacterium]
MGNNHGMCSSTVRRFTSDDRPRIKYIDSRAFGVAPDPDDMVEPWLDSYGGSWGYVAEIDGEVVGGTAAFDMEVSIPGSDPLPAGGVTGVGVLPTHRRRGLLNSLMQRQLSDMRSGGLVMATLTASEAPIYGRFGFGRIAVSAKREIDTTRAQLREDFTPSGSVRFIDVEEARRVMPGLRRRSGRDIPAMVTVPDSIWERIFADYEADRDGASDRFYAVHETAGEIDACVMYRVVSTWTERGPSYTVKVSMAFGLNRRAEMELWAFVTSLDLVRKVEGFRPSDDFLEWMFSDMRAVETVSVQDHNWGRILDPVAAFEARTYPVDGQLVIGFRDRTFEDQSGAYRLTIADGRGRCERCDDQPSIVADAADWASVYFGAVDARVLAAAGRVEGDADRAALHFATDRAPFSDVNY